MQNLPTSCPVEGGCILIVSCIDGGAFSDLSQDAVVQPSLGGKNELGHYGTKKRLPLYPPTADWNLSSNIGATWREKAITDKN